MKKILITIATVIAMLCVLVLAGCEHEHEWGEWKTAKEPTCTEKGVEERICKCGEKETKEIDSLGHINGDWIIDAEPTCTVDGEKHLSCTVCSEITISGPIPATGHSEGEWITDSEPTCTVIGFKHKECTVCKETLETELIAAPGHTEGEWISDTEATCTTDGSKHQICSVCNETIKTETIAATGHTEGEWITDLEPTCNTDGSEYKTCTVCKETTNSRPINALGHDYTETITKATEDRKASVKFDCKVCNESHTEDFDSITVYASLTGSGITMTGGGMYYTRSFEVTAFGGYGEYQYKFESGSTLLQDYSTSNEVEVYGNVFVDSATITITVKDELGQKTVYQIKGNGSYVDSYAIYE